GLGRQKEAHPASRADDSDLRAGIARYERAFRRQAHAPEAVALAREPAAIQALYGIDEPRTADFGRKCLLARRLVERGVRFVQIYSGGNHNDNNWDAHGDLLSNHHRHPPPTPKPLPPLPPDLPPP